MNDDQSKQALKELQLKMLRIQQGVWHRRGRVIIVFEGMDAAGKGGAIRKITEVLDPRGVEVHPIGPPTPEEQGKHWLYRFWAKLPSPGIIAIFDRSWYGRVLVERVEDLTPKTDWQRGYREINQFEKMLTQDGVHLIKIFLKISKDEQLKRFEDRVNDPYKQWKLTKADLKARQHWEDYEGAVEDMVKKTSAIPWHVIETDDKNQAREAALRAVTTELKTYQKWMEKEASAYDQRKLLKEIKKLR